MQRITLLNSTNKLPCPSLILLEITENTQKTKSKQSKGLSLNLPLPETDQPELMIWPDRQLVDQLIGRLRLLLHRQ